MNDIRQLSINKLLLDLENPRFPSEVNNQRAAINLMLKLQEEKIIRLAKDISINGIDPSENLIVYESPDEPGFYIVAEGNRRTTALKLIAQPDLSENNRIRKIFAQIKEKTIISLSKVSSVIVKDESYVHWVNLKHTGDNKGVGRERWTTPEADRYRAKHGKISYQSQLYAFMMSQEDEYKEIIQNKKFVYATNLSRLFGDKKTMSRFGLTSLDGSLYCSIPYITFIENFKKILNVMTDINLERKKPDFSVNRIYTTEDREVFLNELEIIENPELLPNAWRLNDPDAKEKATKSNTNENKKDEIEKDEIEKDEIEKDEIEKDETKKTENGSQEKKEDESVTNSDENIINKNKPIPKTNRNILIPSTLKLNFDGNIKCSKIFNELKTKMTHDTTAFSISVMLRVFLDLSLTEFIERKKIIFKDHPKFPGLHDKVVMCSDYLRTAKLLTQTQCSSIGAFSKAKLNANGTIQQYVHNQHMIPSRDIVNTEWDNFQPLLEAIWSPKTQR
ncbi:hypothetical protein HA050_01930 [Iodobacter sp. HSC-16F04]|uniref:ParB/Sulfiredoxin domain-containing protein n=1 Tax=Iodobacter violaceini TaxID=3044271 RepID=A0ABX0KRF1_9NEIS|nr:hypothetical protein [Iodobacter violacea]NHQ84870.1 hypothetical protein [Iodobacter violacea]